jgi:hypothetical protein
MRMDVVEHVGLFKKQHSGRGFVLPRSESSVIVSLRGPRTYVATSRENGSKLGAFLERVALFQSVYAV